MDGRPLANALVQEKTPAAESARAAVRGTVLALSLGLALTLIQVVLGCVLAGKPTLEWSYFKLMQWDGGWYWSILELGYDSRLSTFQGTLNQANVAFFPGYPLAARGVKSLLGLSEGYVALLVTAQLCCWGFWTYLILFFQRWRVPLVWSVAALLMLATHPAAFYLVASYSESLFLMALLGFLYWFTREKSPARWAAPLHGLAMTATRLVGLPLAIFPLFHAWLNAPKPAHSPSHKLRPYVVPALMAGLALLGASLFFAFSFWRFGKWNLYMEVERIGWGIHPNYFALFDLKTYKVGGSILQPAFLDHLSIPWTCLLFAALFGLECFLASSKASGSWRQRAGFYGCAALMFYVSVCGRSSLGMTGMIRYILCVQVLLVLALVHLLATSEKVLPQRLRYPAGAVLALWCAISLSMQLWYTYLFTHGQWVA